MIRVDKSYVEGEMCMEVRWRIRIVFFVVRGKKWRRSFRVYGC